MFKNRTFGVEIEFIGDDVKVQRELARLGVSCKVEGLNHTTKRHWKIVTDGSVRGKTGEGLGLELVSPILTGETGLVELKKVCEGLEIAGAIVNKTCGLHVHHGAGDFTINCFKNLLKLYMRFESVMDELVAPSRRGRDNRYCGTVVSNISDIALSRTGIAGFVDVLSRNRYRKLNIKSFVTHGTVEFRQHQGTISFEKISNWVKLTQAMVERATSPMKAGKMTNWSTFKDCVFYRNNYDVESASILKYYTKRRKELATLFNIAV